MTIDKLLCNELIRKYFGCDRDAVSSHNCQEVMAYRVLKAMCEPLKQGDKYLGVDVDADTKEYTAVYSWNWFPGFLLRLPDQFQVKPDPVEEYKQHLIEVMNTGISMTPECAKESLDKLISLARENK